MLPCNKSKLYLNHGKLNFSLHDNIVLPDGDKEPQHLYITSNEIPKANDWCINDNADTLYRINGLGGVSGWNKVIATTDTSLNQDVIARPYPLVHLIPQSFIEHFITEYNKGNVISKVQVEYDLMYLNKRFGGIWQPFPDEFIEVHDKKYVLKINPDNTINIQLLKDSWNRDEVIELFKLFSFKYTTLTSNDLHKWINNNL